MKDWIPKFFRAEYTEVDEQDDSIIYLHDVTLLTTVRTLHEGSKVDTIVICGDEVSLYIQRDPSDKRRVPDRDPDIDLTATLKVVLE